MNLGQVIMIFLDHLSARLGVPYRFLLLPPDTRAYLANGEVVLNTDQTPERAHWAYCHEVAHLRLNHPSDFPHDELENSLQEAEANRLAGELLLPEDQFRSQMQKTLLQLKALFPYASYEALARRRQFFRPGILTIFDNAKRTARLTPDGWNRPARLFPLEKEAYHLCWEKHEEVLLFRDDYRAEATFVDQGRGVLRVIVFLEGEEG